MGKSYKHQRMYDERNSEAPNDGKHSPRYGRFGNRRKEMARLKKVALRKDRRKANRETDNGTGTNRPIETPRFYWC